MPTPLLPPPTPLLSALPCPPPQAPTPSASVWSGWSPQSTSAVMPTLSSSAPAELPSFELEQAARATKASRKRSGVSILNSSDDMLNDTQASSTTPLPLLAAALQQQKTKSDDLSINTSTLSLKQPHTTASSGSLSHSQSFSSGELTSMLGSAMKLPAAPKLSSPSVSVAANDARTMQQSTSSFLHTHTHTQRHATVKSAMNSDQRSMSRLSSFASLAGVVQSDHYVIVDLDDTVYCQYHTPCSMMSESGLQRYSAIINSHDKYRHLPFATKSSITRALQSAVSRKRGVEADTIATIKAMQSRGIPLFALTARFASMIATTRTELASLGLDLSLTSPFPSFVQDSLSSAVLCDGVIYTNAQEKGPILNRFLTQLFDQYLSSPSGSESHSPSTPTLQSLAITPASSSPILASSKPIQIPSTVSAVAAPSNGLSSSLPTSSPIIFKTSKKLKYKKLKYKFDDGEDLDGKQLDAKPSSPNSPTVNGTRLNIVSLPAKLIFVDDRLQNLVSVMNGCKVALTLNIGIACYHYTPVLDAELADESDDEDGGTIHEDHSDDDETDADRYIRSLIDYQVHHFIAHQVVLRDHDAKKHRRLSRAPSPTLKQASASPQSHSSNHNEDDEVNGIIGMV